MTPVGEVPGGALDHRIVARLLRAGWAHRRGLLLALLLVPVTTAAQLAQPWLLKVAVDRHLVAGRLEGLATISLAFLAAMAVQHAAGYAIGLLVERVGQGVVHDLRTAIFAHLHRLPAAFFDRNPVGRLVTRLTSDLDAVNDLFTSGAVSFVGDVVGLAAAVVLMFLLDARLAGVVLAAVPVIFLFGLVVRRRMRQAYREVRAQVSRLNTCLQERISGIDVVRLFHQQRRTLRELVAINREYRSALLRAIRLDAMLFGGVGLAGEIVAALVLWWAGGGIARGVVELGTLVAFLRLVDRFFGPIRDLSSKFALVQAAAVSGERVFALLDEPVVLAAPASPAALPPRVEELRLEGVRFGYRDGEEVLKGIELTLRRGETVAVVGPSGSGKTTLAKLLNRSYDPTEGRITAAGVDLRALDPRELRRRLGVVLQDVHLFSGSVLWNVRLGDESVPEARVQEAISLAGAGRVVARLGGLEGRLSERGGNLSAGERQLLAIARAIAFDPDVVILDEATSNVDPETDALLREAVRAVLAGRTSLVIAHRLSTVRSADRIVVLHRGEVREQGTHEELLARGGIYRRLVELQLGKDGLPGAAPDARQGDAGR